MGKVARSMHGDHDRRAPLRLVVKIGSTCGSNGVGTGMPNV